MANVVQYTRFINCTFRDNFAARGGGLAVVDGSPDDIPTQVKVVNSLFYNNKALEITTLDIFTPEGGDARVVLRKTIFRSKLAAASHQKSGTGILPVR